MKNYLFVHLIFALSLSSYAQGEYTISINDINSHITKLASSLNTDACLDKMYMILDYDGNRWIYIESMSIDGLPSDESYLSLELSNLIVKMLYKSVCYTYKNPPNLKTFVSLMKDNNFKGVQFKTKNNVNYFYWDKLQDNI